MSSSTPSSALSDIIDAFQQLIGNNETLELSDISSEPSDILKIYHPIFGGCEFLINVLGVYLIRFQNGKIDRIRNHLLLYQIACTCTDLYITLLAQPMTLMPILAVFAIGFLAKWGLPSHFIWIVLLVLIGLKFVTLVHCFLRKHGVITKVEEKHNNLHKHHWCFMITMITYIAICIFLFSLSKTDEKEQNDIIMTEYPMFEDQFRRLNDFTIYKFNLKLIVAVSMIALLCAATIVVVSILFSQMYFSLQRAEAKISTSSMDKHKAAVRSLIAHFVVNQLGILPYTILLVSIVWKNNAFRNLCGFIYIFLPTHSLINSIVMIITYPEFRTFFTKRFKKSTDLSAANDKNFNQLVNTMVERMR